MPAGLDGSKCCFWILLHSNLLMKSDPLYEIDLRGDLSGMSRSGNMLCEIGIFMQLIWWLDLLRDSKPKVNNIRKCGFNIFSDVDYPHLHDYSVLTDGLNFCAQLARQSFCDTAYEQFFFYRNLFQ